MDILNRKTKRRLSYLLDKKIPTPYLFTLLDREDNDYKEIINLCQKYKISHGELLIIWRDTQRDKRKRISEYDKAPMVERKDNKDFINYGNGSGNKNKIRYPKKVRKTAWKRFYKLFPHLKDQERD